MLFINCICLGNAALQQPSDHCHIKHEQLPEPMLKRAAAMACRDSQVMQRALDTHDTVLRALLSRYYGYEVTTEGDSFTMAFHDPVDAVLLLQPPVTINIATNNGTITIIIITVIVIMAFPAHDELGTCRTSLVSPEQPVLCISRRQLK